MRGLIFAPLLALSLHSHAQILHAEGDRPSFEVVSIKAWHRTPPPPGLNVISKITKVAPTGPPPPPSNRVRMTLPLEVLIAFAYNLPPGSGRIFGAPEWAQQDTDQWQIEAKIDDTLFAAMQTMAPQQKRQQVLLMEQSLLADRFKLKVHFETRDLPIYKLVTAKGGSKLTPAKDGEASKLTSLNTEQGSEMVGTAVSMQEFVTSPLLTGRAENRVIVDETGLKGKYNFTLKTGSDSSTDGTPLLFTAIQEQLGLRLVPDKAPTEVLVVDHIEKPSEN